MASRNGRHRKTGERRGEPAVAKYRNHRLYLRLAPDVFAFMKAEARLQGRSIDEHVHVVIGKGLQGSPGPSRVPRILPFPEAHGGR